MMMTPFYIVLGLGAVMIGAVAIVLILAAAKPKTFRVESSLDIHAPAQKIFPILEDLKQQQQWSTWDQMDPTMKREYSGADRGVGSVYAWDSGKMGAGRQEIVGVTPNERVDIKIDFFRPFRANNKTEFLLRPAGNGTNVTWAMFGPAPFIHRVMHVVMRSDKMVATEFAKGLLQLKALAEK